MKALCLPEKLGRQYGSSRPLRRPARPPFLVARARRSVALIDKPCCVLAWPSAPASHLVVGGDPHTPASSKNGRGARSKAQSRTAAAGVISRKATPGRAPAKQPQRVSALHSERDTHQKRLAKPLRSDAQAAFVSLLKETRRKAGLTQTDVAQRLGKPQSFVAKYQGSERRLDVLEFIAVARAIDADPLGLMRQILKTG